VILNVRKQNYLPKGWKWVIALTSLLMLGPAMTHVYAIGAICAHLRNPTKFNESATKQIVKQAALFASMTRFAEIFGESIPQFSTQLVMTSAMGIEGFLEMPPLQWFLWEALP
jgi:hypothetical protein